MMKKLHVRLGQVQFLHYYIVGGANMGELKDLRIEKR